ncbi:DUF3408 domain-containing protein [Dysgonomonas sp. ZJ279]|uniref:DUF3408 domain-containing protein n=1 Tax=Dysgonomonas sp. ZJ279 TaxID=2709796 RepID=UPI0013E9BF4A|nr:DUF3408 domain-containing protein [Dysgonomonas sp. ZJ279]
MAKRKRFEVDEEKLKRMIAGEIPIKADPEKDIIFLDDEPEDQDSGPAANKPVEKPGDTIPQTVKAKPETAGNEKEDIVESARNSKRKKNKQSYTELFLCKSVMGARRQTSIHMNEQNYMNISKLLKTTDGISMSNFINNLLANHFEIYTEEIEEALRDFIESLSKK